MFKILFIYLSDSSQRSAVFSDLIPETGGEGYLMWCWIMFCSLNDQEAIDMFYWFEGVTLLS